MTKRSGQQIYEFERFRLDAASLMLSQNGKEVSLPPKAIETLLALVERSGEIVPKDELMEIIWTDSIVEESNLSQYLHLLRKTLGKTRSGNPFIETLKRRGYRFNGDVARSVNGFLPRPPRDVEENGFSKDNRGGKSANLPGYRVERQGNVLALAEWKERETDFSSKPESVEDIKHHSGSKPKHSRAYIAAAVFAALLFSTLSIIWFNSASDTENSQAKGDLTFLNLTSGEDVNYATISPDGNYFVYSSQDGEKAHLWLQQTGQVNRLEIISPFAGSIRGTTFTPDSQFVYFIVSETPDAPDALYRVPTLGGVRTKILTDIEAPVSFSPNGREMVFGRRNQEASQSSLVIASSDGTRERVLLTRTGEDAINASAWSPDGRSIAYGAVKMTEREGQCTIVGIDPQSGETKTLSPEKWDQCYRMAWTRDGQGLVFIGTKFRESSSTRRDQIYYLSIAHGESRRLTTDGSRHEVASLSVTDADEILAVPFNRLSQIWAMDASGDSRTAVQITRGFADGRAGIAPLADGRAAYITRNGDGFSIWLINADGSDRKQLTTEPPEIEELRAEPDGRFFIFSAKRDGWSHLYRVDADGANLKQLTFGNSIEVDSTVSPDGNWIIYNSYVFDGNYGSSTLWKIPSSGGETVRISDIDCQAPHFSPDGKFVSCVAADWKKISIISVDDGTTLKTFETTENPILNIGSRWTPDGKALVYIVFHKNVGNLWLHPINGEAPRPLTDFTSGDIYNFAFSLDGSRLYTARGYSIRNAVLIRNFR